MDSLESLSPAEQKEFAKWMKFHGVYKTLEKQMEGEDEDEDEGEGEEKEYKISGSKMLMAKDKLGTERLK
jgi:hypothetical protein